MGFKLFSALLIFAGFLYSGSAKALTCFGERPVVTIEDLDEKSDVVFFGEASVSQKKTMLNRDRLTTITYKVLEPFKGVTPLTTYIKVTYPPTLGAFNSPPSGGQKGLVGASYDENNILTVTPFSACSKAHYINPKEYFDKKYSYKLKRAIYHYPIIVTLFIALACVLFLIYRKLQKTDEAL